MREVTSCAETAATIAGINIGGTTTSVVGGLEDGTVVARWSAPTPATDGALLLSEAIAAVRAVAPAARSVGVAVGGPLDAARGIVTSAPHLPGLHGIPLRDRLRSELGIPVRVHHDAAACALAEWRWGADAGAAGLAYLTCGTGFGAGIVLDGKARYGSDGRSPEIGHVRYSDAGPDIFGKPGCYEGYGSANALALLARMREPARFAGATPLMVVNAAREGDAGALEALRANERAVGAACALLADLLALDVIVLGTLAAYLGDPWIARVRAAYEADVLPEFRDRCRLRPAMADVQDRGALAAALEATA